MSDQSTAGGTTGPLTVLLVEQDASVREAVVAAGEANGAEVVAVADADAALDRLGTTPFGCVVAELDTPGVDRRFVAQVRERAPECPVAWLTERDPTALDEATLSAADTIVEKAAGDDWAFLFEKLRGLLHERHAGPAGPGTFEMLVETARDGIYTLDASGRVTYLNESFADLLGYEREEILGRHASGVMREGELERGQRVVQRLIEDEDAESDVMDMEMAREDGEPITVSVHFTVLTDEDGTYEGLMGVVRDVTERKRRERELQRQRDRLEEFTSVVSHDLRTPLGVAKGNLSLALEDLDEVPDTLREADAALDRMDDLLGDLLELARQGRTVEERERVRLAAVVEAAHGNIPSPPALRADLGDATVSADADRLRQALANLLRNSVEHAGEDATVRVGALADGFYVADDGPGLPAEDAERVFDHGFTTSDDGSGFGLSIVQRIVEAHGWRIAAVDTPEGGARFEVTGVSSLRK